MDALQFNKAVSQHCKEFGGDCYQKPHTLHKRSRACESCGNDTVV